MNLIIMGPQGSGKGTQAKLLIEELSLAYFSPGEVLRDLIEKGGRLARKVDEIINKQGKLIPDKLMMEIMDDFLARKDLTKGVLFDGYPRNIVQLEMLDDWLTKKNLKLDRVIYLFVSREESIRRLSARFECPKCEAFFNSLTMPPKEDGICDHCQTPLIRRADDQPAAIAKRLEIFEEKTAPLIKVYRERGILEEVDGERSIEEINQDIMGRLGEQIAIKTSRMAA